jgi:hypothetical protein
MPPGYKIFHEMKENNRNTGKVRALFRHNVARHMTLRHMSKGKAQDRANASEMAEAAIHRYDERHGLTRRALPAFNHQPVREFKLDRQGQIALRNAERAHRAIELEKKRAENARREEGKKLAQKASKKVNKDVDDLADLFGKMGGRRTRRRHRRHRTRRSTRA